MSKIEDGGPVYPFIHTGMKGDGMHTEQRSGMSLRDHFASQALPAIIAATSANQHMPAKKDGEHSVVPAMCRDAYEIADAMIAARKGGEA